MLRIVAATAVIMALELAIERLFPRVRPWIILSALTLGTAALTYLQGPH